jgi:hypothetical protein
LLGHRLLNDKNHSIVLRDKVAILAFGSVQIRYLSFLKSDEVKVFGGIHQDIFLTKNEAFINPLKTSLIIIHFLSSLSFRIEIFKNIHLNGHLDS